MERPFLTLLILAALGVPSAAFAKDLPDCSRPLTLGLHEHGLLYSSDTDTGIDTGTGADSGAGRYFGSLYPGCHSPYRRPRGQSVEHR